MPWRRLRPAAPVAIFLLLLGALRIWVGWQAIAAVFVVLSGASLVLAALMLVGIRPKGRPGRLAPLLALPFSPSRQILPCPLTCSETSSISRCRSASVSHSSCSWQRRAQTARGTNTL